MRKSPKIFGYIPLLQRLKHHLNLDERGFVLAELVIGLPLIVILLLSLNNIFASSLTKCKSMFADFILQQEIESVMSRIVKDAQIAYKIKTSDGKLRFYQHEMPSINKVQDREGGKPWYKLKGGAIYYNGEYSPITSGNYLSGVIVKNFEYYQNPDHPKLLYITIEAESFQTKHRIRLTTEVYMRGLQ